MSFLTLFLELPTPKNGDDEEAETSDTEEDEDDLNSQEDEQEKPLKGLGEDVSKDHPESDVTNIAHTNKKKKKSKKKERERITMLHPLHFAAFYGQAELLKQIIDFYGRYEKKEDPESQASKGPRNYRMSIMETMENAQEKITKREKTDNNLKAFEMENRRLKMKTGIEVRLTNGEIAIDRKENVLHLVLKGPSSKIQQVINS